VASIASLVEFPVLVVVESVLELDRLLLRLRLLFEFPVLVVVESVLELDRLLLLALACFVCLVDLDDPPRRGPLSWSAAVLSHCSGSDDTSPSSSPLPLCECILLSLRGATPSVSCPV
jgi:hypothetical protein